MVARLVIVSNRVAAPQSAREAQAGGLAVAVKAALKNRSGLWFGWSGQVRSGEPEVAEPDHLRFFQRNHMAFALVDLTAADYQEYYSGFANRVLWPILHYRVDLQDYSRADASGYLRVNQLFADRLSPFLSEGDVIWVHDYHLMPLARELRARGHLNPIGFFLHIPCAPPDILQTLPHHEEILGALTHYDLVGFQTDRDRDNFADYLMTRGARRERNGSFEIDDRRVRIGAFPVSIESRVFGRLARRVAHSPFARMVDESLGRQRLILSVDRLDYSKGIPHRIQAFGHFLETCPEWRGNVTLLQIAPRSRSEIKEYAEIESTVAELIGRVNGRFGEPHWTPIRYTNRSYPRADLAGLYRRANVAMVTPLRDGMNLVAKEFLAAQDPDDPGVLVLSEFTGAAVELKDALIVNPHEIEGVAAKLKQALEMPQAERCERHAPMRAQLMSADISRWAESFLTALGETRQNASLLDGLRGLFGVLVNTP
ncbi:alpha,alpha-trehalose-phosphate synthase (UDP-forming) [Rhodoblastus sp.]|uniref:alpha,alpha-trehalose-phosphate synthase (UDP-forming) n=1 Tax=Rhodoblastus sp. TaxID=1962975 RepID=UPI0035B3C62F